MPTIRKLEESSLALARCHRATRRESGVRKGLRLQFRQQYAYRLQLDGGGDQHGESSYGKGIGMREATCSILLCLL
jgi:hypothetical protein